MARSDIWRECYCHTCKRWFHSLGIASHRAAHRRRHQSVKITYTNGDTYRHDFDKEK